MPLSATASDPAVPDDSLDPALIRLGGVLILGAALAQLDATIVNVGIGAVGRSFHAALTSVQWISTGYLLAVALVAPLSGWLVQRAGGRRTWLSSVAVFVIASAGCGLAWSTTSLVVFRVLQGIGGGLMQPIGQALVARHAGPRRIGRLVGIITVPVTFAPVLGPVLGGLIVHSVGWRWMFYVNVPIGLVTLLLAARVVPDDDAERAAGLRPDTVGLLTLPTGLAAVVYGLSEVGRPASGPAPTVALVAGALLLAGYAVHALRTRRPPLLDLRLFARRGYTVAGVNTFLLGAALYSSMLLIPLYFIQVRGADAWQAGLLLAPQALGTAAATPLAGRLTNRLGPRAVVLTGILLTMAGTVPFVLAGNAVGPVGLGLALFVRGAGLGATVPPNVAAIYTAVGRSEVPAATSARTVLNRIGGSIGTATLAVVLQDGLVHAASSGTGPAPAYAHAFWWALAFGALTLVPAAFYPGTDRRTTAPARA